jgi:hypothetical protein
MAEKAIVSAPSTPVRTGRLASPRTIDLTGEG